MKKILCTLSVFSLLAACQVQNFQISLSRPLTVDAKNVKSLPAGNYAMVVKGGLGSSKVVVSNSKLSAEFKIKNAAAKQIAAFYNDVKSTGDAKISLSEKALNQPFAVNLQRNAKVTGTGAARNQEQNCVLSTERVQDGEDCSYGPFCQTQTTCSDSFGRDCSTSDGFGGTNSDCTCRTAPADGNSSFDCQEQCTPHYVDQDVYGTQTVRIRDVTYQVTSQAQIVQNNVRAGTIATVTNTVQGTETLSEGACR